jgi:hypothetical protein
LPGILIPPEVVAIKYPPLFQFFPIPIEGSQKLYYNENSGINLDCK